MYYNHQLRANIQEWRNRFLKSDYNLSNNSFNFLFDKLNNEAIIRFVFGQLIIKYQYSAPVIFEMVDHGIDRITFVNDVQQAAFNYQLCKWIIDEKKDFRYSFSMGVSVNTTIDYFKDNIITPLIDYIHDQLNEVSSVLYIIEKYKLRTEWFTKNSLKEKYNSIDKNFEDLLEEDLRLFLFDQGIDYPFSTPKSASGRADVISLIDTEDPLVLEIKIYDSQKNYKKDRIISGFSQIVKYSNDYHKDTGYLVVFNMDNIEIEIQGKESDNKWPSRFLFNGKTYYIIFINMNSDVTASKQGQLKKEVISFDELTKNADQ
ncbi:MAG TPA: hypothetical protein PKN32_06290 [Bacteroidales bacterium]|nr:hypothetical protein [Bacteroidales bacterium]